MNYQQLCEESHEISKEKGWLDVPRSFDGDIALMHEELSEALGDYRSHKGLNETYYEVSYDKVEPGPDGSPVTYRCSHPSMSQLALDDLRKRDVPIQSAKPCGIPTELADLVIRIAQYCGSNKVNLPAWMANLSVEGYWQKAMWRPGLFYGLDNFESFLRQAHWLLAQVDQGESIHERFAQCVKYVVDFCARNGIDLEAAIKMKAAYNRTRPHRHGGRKI